MIEPTFDVETAFESAYRRHYSRILTIASRFAAVDSEAEELTQEAFLRLYDAPVLRQAEVEVRAWLVRVVTNLGLNAARGRRREKARMNRLGNLELANTMAGAADSDPIKVIVRAEEQRLVRELLRQLPPRARAGLVLRHSGLSYAEIARVIGVAPGSVGTLLARAELAFMERWKRCTNEM
ncbi:MAG: sigma-70 family RNA polymerase sigma factor [Chloroflexi bacterium]|nr:sigma-70 family RNA polymerase sigma factor [Chloroflexota bacterium]